MKNGTLTMRGDTRAVLRFERHLRHPVERVWRAITDPDELRHWSPAIPEWTLEPGATFTVEAFGDGTGEILEVDPPHLLAYEFAGQAFRFELSAHGDGCTLVFVHEFDDPGLAAQHAAGWDVCFDRMDALLAGGALSDRDALVPWLDLNDRYAERFGIDPEIGRRTYEEHMKQFT